MLAGRYRYHVRMHAITLFYWMMNLRFVRRSFVLPSSLGATVNGSEFTAKQVRSWLDKLGTKPLFIEPGSLWENGYIESFNGKMRDEFLNREIFDTVLEAKVLTEEW